MSREGGELSTHQIQGRHARVSGTAGWNGYLVFLCQLVPKSSTRTNGSAHCARAKIRAGKELNALLLLRFEARHGWHGVVDVRRKTVEEGLLDIATV